MRAVLRQALDAATFSRKQLDKLWVSHHANGTDAAIELCDNAITAIKQALAEPESEPVAWRWSEVGSTGIERWFYWTTDWENFERAKSLGCKIEFAFGHPPQPSKRDTGKAYNDGRRAMLDEVLRIAPDSVAVLLERLKEGGE